MSDMMAIHCWPNYHTPQPWPHYVPYREPIQIPVPYPVYINTHTDLCTTLAISAMRAEIGELRKQVGKLTELLKKREGLA